MSNIVSRQWRGVLNEYRDRLDISDATLVITLGEGGTPLVPAPALSARTGAKVWVKYEGMNPTGSFKDRGMTMAISKAVEHGVSVEAVSQSVSDGKSGSLPTATLVIVTHEATESSLASTVAALGSNDVVSSVVSVLRVEGL